MNNCLHHTVGMILILEPPPQLINILNHLSFSIIMGIDKSADIFPTPKYGFRYEREV